MSILQFNPDFYTILDSEIPGTPPGSNRKVYLSRISIDGVEEMHEYSSDERLYRHFEYARFESIDQTRRYLQKLLERRESIHPSAG